jgi:hypothetical protein
MKMLGIPFHPFLLAAFPVISLLGHNIEESPPGEAGRALIASFGLVLVIFLVGRVLFHDWRKGALAASIFTLVFFSYGHVYGLIEQRSLLGFMFGRHRYLAPVWLVGLISGMLWINTFRETVIPTRTVNLISAIALVFPLLQVASHQIQVQVYSGRSRSSRPVDSSGGSDGQVKPDLYYIILDAYTRDDTLLSFYDHDNSSFLRALEERGFYIAECSQSNYAWTFLSLSSSLNMNFVQVLSPSNNRNELVIKLKDSEVRRRFENLGYTIVAFDTGYHRTQWEDPDVYLKKENLEEYESRLVRGLTEFEALLLNETALRFFLEANTSLGTDLSEVIHEPSKLVHYNRVNFTLDSLPTLSSLPGPKLIFTHIVAPHRPHVFGPNGEFLADQPDLGVPGYRKQVVYLNKRLIPIIEALLADSDPEPIIIIQGDHGGSETLDDFQRMNILSAYYFPGAGRDHLYSNITPVNTFRILFDTYFGEDLGRLPDISYYSVNPDKFRFTVAPDDRPGCDG